MLQSRLCTQDQFQTRGYLHWCRQMKEPLRLHRKLWEFCYIDEALHERGLLAPGKSGLGFGVGEEPLPALFASYGCSIVATDMDEEGARSAGWAESHQHMGNLAAMNSRGLCDARLFSRLVTRRVVDMNAIPPDLRDFDFTWSACSLEHVGSIELGIQFILNSVECLQPGGVAVHTTEFNLSSNDETLDNGGTVLFRKKDIERVTHFLRNAGHEIAVSFDTGSGPADVYVDAPPYCASPHLRLALSRFVSTSIGLIIQKKASSRTAARSPSLEGPIHKPLEASPPLSATVSSLELQPTYVGSHRALARILDRFSMVLSTEDACFAPQLLNAGYYDLPLTQLFHEFVRPGMTVADVGADVGYFTLLAADIVGPSGRVYASEPNSCNLELLRLSVAINRFEDRVTVHKAAALSQGTAPAVPFNELLGAPIHLMRIAVPGAHPWVIEGMLEFLAASPGIKIIFAFPPPMLDAAQADPRLFFRRIRKARFLCSLITEEGKLEPIGNEDAFLAGSFTRLFVERL